MHFPQKRLDDTFPPEQRFVDGDGEPITRCAIKWIWLYEKLNRLHARTPTFCTDLRTLQGSFELFGDETHDDFIEVEAGTNPKIIFCSVHQPR